MSDFTIEGFDLEKIPVGQGCTGEVFRAERQSDGRTFAAKRYDSIAVDRVLMGSCFRQYKNMPDHEGIVKLEAYHFGESPYYTLSEWVDWSKLSDSGVHREAEAWAMIRQLADTLGHAHKYGVFHANLHPGNIFHLSGGGESSGKVKIGDFCAGMVGDYHFVDISANAGFAAPEQLSGLGRDYAGGAAAKWDVYRFGVVAYWLLRDRLPRGTKFLEEHAKALAESEGRPVPLEPGGLAASVWQEAEIDWGRRVGSGAREKRWCEVIEQCLELDPAKRPVDMREIRNQFASLDIEFDLIEAQERANAELSEIENYYYGVRLKQRKKLISARASATILAISWFAATYFLVTVLQKTIEGRTRINKLDQVVANQKARITSLDHIVEDTANNLRRSREAADTSFYHLTRANSGGTSMKDLESVRLYYVKVLDEVSAKDGISEERARALHSLAHIEYQMSRKPEAEDHFAKAIESFHAAQSEYGNSADNVDIIRRLADCYEHLGLLKKEHEGSGATDALKQAITYYRRVLDLDSGDNAVALRLALVSYQYGQNLFSEKRVEEAVASYTDAADKIQALIDSGEIKESNRDLDQIIAELQYHAAEALYNLKRHEDAFDAYMATIESVERLRSVQGFGNHEAIMMARSFMALGDIMRDSKTIKSEDKDQVYNEALRLASPLNRNDPRNVEVASLMCQILSRIADLERETGNPKDGYELSVRGIEGLIRALDSDPGNVEGFIQLAEARLNHLEFLKADVPKSRVIALRGVDTAKHAHELVSKSMKFSSPAERDDINGTLQRIFGSYSEICKDLGEASAASECSQYASFKVSLK
ncbi:MAG: hypothetical protein P1U89_02370 [Verrucomicrobiales bacterium]|nr:hypothetical protein [Verrucomicrobiales bacterium]